MSITREHYDPYGSHLPALVTCVMATTGPVLELGMGYFSTPILHEICKAQGRRLVSTESDAGFAPVFADFAADFHALKVYPHELPDSLFSEPWSVVLIDHSFERRRAADGARFKDAEFIVAHDYSYPLNGVDGETIGDMFMALVAPLYPWHKICSKFMPSTLVLGRREIPIIA